MGDGERTAAAARKPEAKTKNKGVFVHAAQSETRGGETTKRATVKNRRLDAGQLLQF